MRTIEEVVNDFKTKCIGREEIDAPIIVEADIRENKNEPLS